uniref:Uncharacterized protein n=1 Tax=Arundo donax TaxID=35708 RepID=A0A0A9BAZ8_ARUDO
MLDHEQFMSISFFLSNQAIHMRGQAELTTMTLQWKFQIQGYLLSPQDHSFSMDLRRRHLAMLFEVKHLVLAFCLNPASLRCFQQ